MNIIYIKIYPYLYTQLLDIAMLRYSQDVPRESIDQIYEGNVYDNENCTYVQVYRYSYINVYIYILNICIDIAMYMSLYTKYLYRYNYIYVYRYKYM